MTTVTPRQQALSAASRSVWGKSGSFDDSGSLSLVKHLADTAAVAGLLWHQWLPRSVRGQIGRSLPGGEQDGSTLLAWLAAVHDVGKASPAFAIQAELRAPHLLSDMRANGLVIEDMALVHADRRFARHELVSHMALEAWLQASYGFSRKTATTYAVVVGGHHGAPPTDHDLNDARQQYPHLVGTGLWAGVRTELLEYMAHLTGADALLGGWAEVALPMPVQVLLTGAVIMADWIASDTSRFPSQDPTCSRERALRAWDDLALPPPWCANPPADDDELFASRFALPPGASPRPIQQAAAAAARRMMEPGLIVMEAPMGIGKTEAALAEAEILAARWGAGGLIVALPTMATSDAMFTRIREWVGRLPASGGGDDPRLSMFLAHGKAALNPEVQALRWGHGPSDVGCDEGDAPSGFLTEHPVAVAHSWLSGRKRGLLSSVVVGTIDQVLFAGLKSKHLALRHLALASKVVIIDEVHAVDVYMGSYLERVLHWLGAFGVPTVLLSATLPAALRQPLVDAYTSGRAAAEGVPRSRRTRATGLAGDIGYPALISASADAVTVTVTVDDVPPRRVALERLADDDDALLAALHDALADGGCVGVVRNTVTRAQATYELLAHHFDAEVVLLHSRLLATDRSARERLLRERLGPPAAVGRAGQSRPHRLVLVGTQVVEQSLDIDLDLLVTDLAPVDLVLQRLGRLHRHSRGDGESQRPPRLRHARCLISGVSDWTAEPPSPDGGSERVYHRSPLLRALAVLREPLERGWLKLPDDIAPLVQSAYDEGLVPPPGWESAWELADDARRAEATTRRSAALAYQIDEMRPTGSSLLGWLTGSTGEADDGPQAQARVRDGADGYEVVVTQRCGSDVRLLPGEGPHAGEVVPTEHPPSRSLERAAAMNTLRLPAWMCAGNAVIDALEKRTCYRGWQLERRSLLAGQLVLELDADLTAQVARHHLRYDGARGLTVTTERTL